MKLHVDKIFHLMKQRNVGLLTRNIEEALEVFIPICSQGRLWNIWPWHDSGIIGEGSGLVVHLTQGACR